MKSLILSLILSTASAQTPPAAAPATGTIDIGASIGAAACRELDSVLPDKVVFPAEPQYNTTNKNYFDVRSIQKPACIVLPSTTAEVSQAVTIIRRRLARFAVKSGGHMPGEFNNINDGVLIATEKLNSIQWEGDNVLKIGPGLRWGPVYDEAAKKGRSIIGGRLEQVGVAGLVLGGGVSFTGGEFGWSCDNVKGFEIVLANGTAVYAASDNQHKDLYKALRGGGSNFGIVTRFDMDAVPIAQGWTSFGVSPIDNPAVKAQYLDAIVEYVTKGATADPKTGIVAVITSSPAGNAYLGTTNLWKSVPSASPPAVFQKFLAVPGLHQNANGTLAQLSRAFNQLAQGRIPPPSNQAFRTGTFVANRELILEIARIHEEEFNKIKDVTGISYALTFQPLTANHILTGARKRGGNVLGLEARVNKAPFFMTEQQVSWFLPSDNERVQATQRTIAKRAKDFAQARGLLDPFVYLNDADTDQKAEVFPAYGRTNVAFLRTVKARYDPLGFFTFQQPGGFKL